MRVTGGHAKGITIRTPKGSHVRPTSDKVREALFDTLGVDVADTRVLDLFSGSGALGIEALSRGAEHVTFVEHDPIALRAIAENLARVGLAEKSEIVRLDFRSALRKLGRRERKFHLILADPPYQRNLLENMADAIAQHSITLRETIIVIEHFKKTEPPPAIAGIPLVETRTYGQTALSYFRRT
jgi:16S rRNA (guanine(966)-N(2))-methyltransferase RsmD